MFQERNQVNKDDMKSPWVDNEDAFEPMYTEHITVSGNRLNGTVKKTLFVCVYADVSGDPLSDDMVDTDRKDIVVSCRKDDWTFVKSIQVGDTITRPEANGKRYAVQSIDENQILGIVINARGID